MIEVKTSLYKFTHDREPQGFGQWAFAIGSYPEPFIPGRAIQYSAAVTWPSRRRWDVGARFVVVLS